MRSPASRWSSAPRISICATIGAGRSRRSAPWASISRSASITGGCTAIALAASRQRWRIPSSARCLSSDVNNIRYITSTKIGEWERDKLCRFALLTRGSNDPILWDFGSAAVHKLYAPWLKPENCKAGLIGMRGTVAPAFGLMERHAKEIASLIREAAVGAMPVGVDLIEPPMMFELQKAVVDGQQVMLEAREVKNIDDALLNRAAAMIDGAYHLINEELKPGIRENDIVAKVNEFLYTHGSDDVEAVNAISGERCNPPQFHRPDVAARRSGVLRYPAFVRRVPHLLLPHLQCRPRYARGSLAFAAALRSSPYFSPVCLLRRATLRFAPWYLFADHVCLHVERNGLEVLEQQLGAGSFTLGRKDRLACKLAEPLCQGRWIDEEADAAVLLGNIAEGLLSTQASAIQRTATLDRPLIGKDDLDAEIAQTLGVHLCSHEIVAMWSPWGPLLEGIGDDHDLLHGLFLGFCDRVTEQPAMLGPSRPMFDCGYRPRQLRRCVVPLADFELSRLIGPLIVSAKRHRLDLQPRRPRLRK
jgi:hypothetical protein